MPAYLLLPLQRVPWTVYWHLCMRRKTVGMALYSTMTDAANLPWKLPTFVTWKVYLGSGNKESKYGLRKTNKRKTKNGNTAYKNLLNILLLEPCSSLIYEWKTNKCTTYSFNLLIMLLHVSALHCHPQVAFLVPSERCSTEEQSIEYCGWACCV
jgi:hypothetical protein